MGEIVRGGFSSADAIKTGWHLFKTRWIFWVLLTLFVFFVPAIPIIFQTFLQSDSARTAFLLSVIEFILQILTYMGAMFIALKAVRGEQYSFDTFFEPFHRFPSYLWAMVLSTLAIIGGLLLFIIPGIILALMFLFAGWVVLDTHVSGYQSLKISNELSKGNKMELSLLFLGIVLLNVFGVLLLGVGLLVTYPITLLALAHVYNQIKLQKSGELK